MSVSRQKEYFNLIKAFAGNANILSVPRIFISYTGDLNSALLLSQLLFWSDKGTNRDWIYKTYAELTEEITLSEYQIRKAAKKLTEMDILETKVKRANGSPTVHYHLKSDEFSVSILKFLQYPNQRNLSIQPEETQDSLTEITTEITQEITFVPKSSISEPGTDLWINENSKFMEYSEEEEPYYSDDAFDDDQVVKKSTMKPKDNDPIGRRALEACGRRKGYFADTKERSRWNKIKKSMLPLGTPSKYPTEWIEFCVSWVEAKNRKARKNNPSMPGVLITFPKLLSYFENESKRDDWVAEYAQKLEPEDDEATTEMMTSGMTDDNDDYQTKGMSDDE
jgi:hypothetical protein